MATELPDGRYRVYMRTKGIAPIEGIFVTKQQAEDFEQAERKRVANSYTDAGALG